MTSFITLKSPPRRMLKKDEAAIYCGIPASRFIATCACQPVAMPNGSLMYDIQDLDAWLDNLKANAPDSNDDILQRLG
jgi:hypothetical protein